MGALQVVLAIIVASLTILGIVLGFVYKTSRWVTKQEEENKDIRSDARHKIEMAKTECMHCIDIERQKMTAMKERIDRHDTAIETVTKSVSDINNSVTKILERFNSVSEKIDYVQKYIEEQRTYERRKTDKANNN